MGMVPLVPGVWSFWKTALFPARITSLVRSGGFNWKGGDAAISGKSWAWWIIGFTRPGKLTVCCWKWPSRNSGFTQLKMVIFHSYVNVYQSVSLYLIRDVRTCPTGDTSTEKSRWDLTWCSQQVSNMVQRRAFRDAVAEWSGEHQQDAEFEVAACLAYSCGHGLALQVLVCAACKQVSKAAGVTKRGHSVPVSGSPGATAVRSDVPPMHLDH